MIFSAFMRLHGTFSREILVWNHGNAAFRMIGSKYHLRIFSQYIQILLIGEYQRFAGFGGVF